ncbi:hypothetical protein MJO29_001495 [Puccinia striiformis f. sp. tritici]|nr:hypothetical protein MJO29_001495 [Puccinia striiformis f. sp. tritici]
MSENSGTWPTADRNQSYLPSPPKTPKFAQFKPPISARQIVLVFRQYSKDVKLIVVKMSRRGLSLNEINDTLDHNVSPDSLRRWVTLYQTTMDVVRNPDFYQPRGQPVKVTRAQSQFILDALELEPTLYLNEIQTHLEALTGERHPISTVHNEIKHRLNLTSKKARTVHPAQCPMARAGYMARMASIPSDHLVFIDECGVTVKTHSRDHAWAPKGRRTVRIPKPLASDRISVLPAVSTEGLLGMLVQQGNMNRMDLEFFLDEILLPNMNAYPAPNSVLVLDNASLHHGGMVADLCESYGVLLIYLPPYSPDFNPIEKVFSALKTNLKRDQSLTGTEEDIDFIREVLTEIVTPETMANYFQGSNYPVDDDALYTSAV